MSSKHEFFEFGFKVGPLEFKDKLPWKVWGMVPKPNRSDVLKEYRDAVGAWMDHHVPQCRNCKQGWRDPFGNQVQGPCHVFNVIGSAIRRTWHKKLERSLQVMTNKHRVERKTT